ncbi:metallophosphatase family protein [bacterium]|nr:metallophosphatase family protein [bacterium]
MLHAIISDIHGNLPALSAVLDSIGRLGAARVVCLGDVVGYGAEPAECLRLTRESCSSVILGNHDAAVAGRTSIECFNSAARAAVLWTRKVLTAEEIAWLAALPYEDSPGVYRTVHATPDDPAAWSYLMSDDHAEELFGFFSGPLLFFGHTHYPMLFEQADGTVACLGAEDYTLRPGARCIINPGSVGQPRDGDPRASFGLLDDGTGRFTLQRVEYDIPAAQHSILEAGLPAVLAERLARGR